MTLARVRVALVMAMTATLAAACSQANGPAIVKTGTEADSAEQVMYGVRAPITESGVRRGVLTADSMYVFNDQTRFDFFQGTVDFNTATGAPNGTMTGNKGRYDSRTEILEGWGNVVVTTTEGNMLKSPHVIYDQRKNLVTSDTSYTLVTKGKTLTGFGLTADSHFNDYQCARLCSATGQVVIPK